MHDRLFESETFGRPLDFARYARPLVLAPHPDDEAFGCGGLLALWAAQGVRPLVVLLTSGQAQPGAAQATDARLRESEAGAQLLGCDLQAWGLSDREVRCDDALIERVGQAIAQHGADVVLAPALTEPHPDHQATTLALCCAMARRGARQKLPDVLLYESGAALIHPNRLVDITGVLALKQRALAAFESQEAAQPYASRIAARDHFRGMTLGPAAKAAEAYMLLEARDRGWPAVVAALEPLYLHGRGQAATETDLPLVSVLVRTIGDAHLERTLASVAAQTYARLDVVVVAAHGHGAAPAGLPARPGQELRWVCTGPALNRPQAANAALDAARGDLLIFLDDDDLWAPDLVAKLVAALQAKGGCSAAHTDAAVVDAQGAERTRYDQPYEPLRMAFTNTLPIHTVLFERRLVTERGCRFDEGLPVLEDWDFWLQVTAYTDVVHTPGVSAFYRWSDRSRLTDEDDRHHHRQWRDTVQARWLGRWPQDRVLAAIRWYAGQLDQVAQERKTLQVRLVDAAAQVAQLHARAEELDAQRQVAELSVRDVQAELALAGDRLQRSEAERGTWQQRAEAAEGLVRDLRTELLAAGEQLARTFEERQSEAAQHLAKTSALMAEVSTLEARVTTLVDEKEGLLASTSWRMTRPLRWLAAAWRGR
jgi:LmbE family N-acetylglucosaminyl deacetylase